MRFSHCGRDPSEVKQPSQEAASEEIPIENRKCLGSLSLLALLRLEKDEEWEGGTAPETEIQSYRKPRARLRLKTERDTHDPNAGRDAGRERVRAKTQPAASSHFLALLRIQRRCLLLISFNGSC